MELIENHGALIESGKIDGFTYEVRHPDYPMVYVYRMEGSKIIGKPTQVGGTPVEQIVRQLIAELPKAA